MKLASKANLPSGNKAEIIEQIPFKPKKISRLTQIYTQDKAAM